MRRCRGCPTSLEGRRPNVVWCSDACRVSSDRAAKAVQNPNTEPLALPGIPRLKPSARRVLVALRNAGSSGCTTGQLCQPGVGGVRFGARIAELRDAGVKILVSEERVGSYRYKLLHARAREDVAA